MAKEDKKTDIEIKTAQQLKEAFPALVSEIEAEARKPFQIENASSLRQAYPELVNEIEEAVVGVINTTDAKSAQKRLPKLYETLVQSAANVVNKMPSGPGFMLDIDDPFSEGALRTYQNLTGKKNLRLPFVIPFSDKSKSPVNKKLCEGKFEKSETLKSEFKNVNAYIEFESLNIVKAIRRYILSADGAGDKERSTNAYRALLKIKK